MRHFLIILFLLPFTLLGQTRHSLTLELSTGDCRSNESVRVGFQDTIKFSQDGKLYKKIIPMNYSQWPIEIKHFKPGTYSVTFTNLYDQKITRTVVIPDSSEYELDLCPDRLEGYPKSSLAKLQNGDTIRINFHSQGCFKNSKEILTIFKSNKIIFARLQADPRCMKLTPKQIRAYSRFENELKVLKDSYDCTTIDTYTVTCKSTTLTRIDGSCEWNGFYFLRKAIYGESK